MVHAQNRVCVIGSRSFETELQPTPLVLKYKSIGLLDTDQSMVVVDVKQYRAQNSEFLAVGQAHSNTGLSNQGPVSFGQRGIVGGKSVNCVLALVRDPLAVHLFDSRDLVVRPAFNSAFEFLHGDIQPMPGESGKLRRSVKVARRLGQK